MTIPAPKPAPRRGRRRSRGNGSGEPAAGPMLANFTRNVPVYEIAAPEIVERIHHHALQLIETGGIEFRDEAALATWRDAGAQIDGALVRLTGDQLMRLIETAPETFTLHARNSAKSVQVGGPHMVFSPCYGSPFVRGRDGVRRYATRDDFEDLVKLAYMLPTINHSGGTVCEPTDVAVPKRHLDMAYAHLKWSDMPFMGAVTAGERARDGIEMCRFVFGADFVAENPVIMGLVNCNSPRVWDETMLEAVRAYTQAGQAILVSPFPMQGASTPITSPGALVQIIAEALVAVAYTQLIRPGAEVIMGITPSVASMKSGAPTYGSSEAQFISSLGAQLGRMYEIPVRMQGMRTSAKRIDGQAGYESVLSMYASVLAGGHFFPHSTGWLEGGLTTCFAKTVADAEQLAHIQRFVAGQAITPETLAVSAFDEVEPGGQYFGCAHTFANFRTTFYDPESADIMTFEQWSEEGETTLEDRCLAKANRLLESYAPPVFDTEIDKALNAFVERRRAELPDMAV